MTAPFDLYLVTDSPIATAAGHELPALVAAACAGGVTAVQVREKNSAGGSFLRTVLAVAAAVPDGVPVIVNDRVDVYLAAQAAGARVAGVHIGQSDLPAKHARSLVGPDALLGVSTSNIEQLRAAIPYADHVGCGPIRATPTKPEAPAPIGIEGFAALASSAPVPVVAIGGLNVSDALLLRAAGAAGIAVVSAICAAADPERAAQTLRRAWEEGA